MHDSRPPSDSVQHRPHLVDATMFWSRTGGGVARYLRDKRRWARGAGWRHSWVVPEGCEPPGACVGGLPLPSSGGYRFPVRRRDAARAIAALAPDVIEAGDPFTLAWSALDAAAERGVPAVAFCHSNVAAQASRVGSVAGRATRRYLKRVYERFDAVFAASRWMVDEVRDLGLDNVVHQPLGVDLKRFTPNGRSMQWRRSLGIADQATVLIYVGRFAPEKNLQRLVEAVTLLGPDHVLVALGAGPCPPEGRCVVRLPYCADEGSVARALASADVFVHAGTRETFGLAPLESLACGTPVVLPARAGFLDLIDDGAARGAGSGSAREIADAVQSLREADPAALREQARAIALNFSHQRSMAHLFERYAALARTHARAPSTNARWSVA